MTTGGAGGVSVGKSIERDMILHTVCQAYQWAFLLRHLQKHHNVSARLSVNNLLRHRYGSGNTVKLKPPFVASRDHMKRA